MNVLPNSLTDLIPGALDSVMPGVRGLTLRHLDPVAALGDVLPTAWTDKILGTEDLAVHLDSPTNSYYSGTPLTGHVVFRAHKKQTVRGLSVKIKGEGRVEWTEQSKERTGGTGDATAGNQEETTVTTSFTADEVYFTNKFNLLGETEVEPGTQCYKFSCELPARLPSSFAGENGSIKYWVKATVDRPWSLDLSVTRDFTVVTLVDLNLVPAAKERVEKEVTKHFCCLMCQSGPLTVSLVLPVGGYVPGQSVLLSLQVDNASNIQINALVLTITKCIRWTSKNPETRSKETVTEVASLRLEGVDAHGSGSWQPSLPLPPDLPALDTDLCSIIRFSHSLRVVGEVSGCHQNVEAVVPLIIGSVPLRGSDDASSPSAPPQQPPDIGFALPATTPLLQPS